MDYYAATQILKGISLFMQILGNTFYVPLTISIRSQVLVIEGIDIDETTITDTGQREILSIIEGQTIDGTIPRR